MDTTVTSAIMSRDEAIRISIDPLTLVSQECIKIISEVRKNSRFFQSGVAAILGSSDTINLFNDEFVHNFKSLKFGDGKQSSAELQDSFEFNRSKLQLLNNGSTNTNSNDPILSGFLQLKSLLSEINNLSEIDTLTILQPYFLLISSPSTSGLITSITISSLSKLFEYDILFDGYSSKDQRKVKININQLINSLTHTQFESSDPTLDDSVLLKVLDLILKVIKNKNYSKLINNDVFSQVIQINLSLACNKKRSEVLRRYAEQSLNTITIIIFNKMKFLLDPKRHEHLSVDIKFFFQYLLNLISIVSVENQYYHTESTKIFVLSLLSTVIEISGKDMPQFGSILKLVKNQLLKNLLTIILKNDSLNLLQAALQCFISLNLILSGHLTLQLEFAYENIFKSILPADEFNHLDESIDENANPQRSTDEQISTPPKLSRQNTGASKGPTRAATPIQGAVISSRNPLAKELIIESLSLLWSHSSELLINLFISFDCKFDSKNISLIFIKFLNKLAESSSATITTNNVPPICLEGLLQFINGLNSRVKALKKEGISFDKARFDQNKILKMKARKEQFLKILTALNNDDFKGGLETLKEYEYLSKDSPEDEKQKELGEFFYYKAALLNKKNVGEFITKPKNLPILINFLSHFNFKGKRVDESLRMLLQKFRIPGESQQIERVVENFADKYVNDQNYDDMEKEYKTALQNYKSGLSTKEPLEPVTPEKDGVFILSYAIIMLNTDLHNPKVKEHMTFEDFRKNLRGVYKDGKDYPEWYLRTTYNSIKSREIIIPEEHYGTDKWFTGSWDILINSTNDANEKNFVFAFERSLKESEKNENDFKKLKSSSVTIKDIDQVLVSQFDRVLFEKSFPMLLNTFIHVFEETSDDHRVAKLVSIIDKCSNIANYYNLDNVLDTILVKLARLTTLTNEKKSELIQSDDEFIRDVIPTTQIKLPRPESVDVGESKVSKSDVIEDPNALDSVKSNDSQKIYGNRKNVKNVDSGHHTDSEVSIITVSETSTWFGRDFKAQISLVALFNIIRKSNFSNFSKAWSKILIIILKLYENSIIDGNFFRSFQSQYYLGELPKVKPRYVIDRSNKNQDEEKEVSLFSAFTSYLKINSDEPPEPTNEEIDATLLTISCVKTSKVDTIFDNLLEANAVNIKELILGLLKMLPNYSKNSKDVYQSDVLFIFESAVALAVKFKDTNYVDEYHERILKSIEKLIAVNERNNRKLFNETFIVRLVSYIFILFNNTDKIFEGGEDILRKSLQLLSSIDNVILEKYGHTILIETVRFMGDSKDWKYLVVITSVDYWKLLRRIASIFSYTDKVFEFVTSLIQNNPEKIVPENYMSVLGLLDEVSLIGAIGSAYEQEADLAKYIAAQSDKAVDDDTNLTNKKLPDTNPHKGLIDLSIASINLTSDLKSVVSRTDFVEVENKTKTSCWYALIQALGHQTFNPCREIRNHALKVFTTNLLSLDFDNKKFITARGIFELDVFPLVTELLKDEVLYCDYYGIHKTKLDVLSSITKIYLQYLNKSYIIKEKTYSENSELSYIWLTLLDVFKNLIIDEHRQLQLQLKNKKKLPITPKNNEMIKEASKELIKNSLLYMQNHQYLNVDENDYLWSQTWDRINLVFPELHDEFVGEVVELQEKSLPLVAPEKDKIRTLAEDDLKLRKDAEEEAEEERNVEGEDVSDKLTQDS